MTDPTVARRLATREPPPDRGLKRTRNLIIVGLATMLVLILWTVPVVLVVSLGGFAVALVLSFPNFLSRFMPRGVAIFLAFIVLLTGLL